MRTMTASSFLLACALLAPVTARADDTSPAVTVPVETDQVKVTKIAGQPRGWKTPAHEHALDRLEVYLTHGSTKVVDAATGKAKTVRYRPGTVVWAPAGGSHHSENLGKEPLTSFEIDLKRRPDRKPAPPFSPNDPTRTDPRYYKVELENDQVRVVRVRIPPRAKIKLHEHVTNRVVVFLSDQHFSGTTPDGQTTESRHVPGDCVGGGPMSHSEANLTDKPFEALLIDLKN